MTLDRRRLGRVKFSPLPPEEVSECEPTTTQDSSSTEYGTVQSPASSTAMQAQALSWAPHEYATAFRLMLRHALGSRQVTPKQYHNMHEKLYNLIEISTGYKPV
jgi:hypothetical protein